MYIFQCRWLLYSNNCQMSLVCDLKTPQTTGRQQQECSATKSDYLRLVGYGGIVDSKYCGHNKVSIKVHGNHPLALMFKSQKRSSISSSKNRDLGSLLNLLGFDCKIKCKNDLNEEEEETLKNSTPSPADDVIEKVDTINESGESNESTVRKKYLKKHLKNDKVLNCFSISRALWNL